MNYQRWRHARPTNEHGQTFHPGVIYSEDGEDEAVCRVEGFPLHCTLEDVVEANKYVKPLRRAALIAAAPVLAEALQNLLLRDKRGHNPYGHDCMWCGACCDRAESEAQAALDKACISRNPRR